jgi:iron complex outermembrane recepter protein
MNGFASEIRVTTSQAFPTGPSWCKPRLLASLLLITALALLPSASLSEPTSDDLGEIKAAAEGDLRDTTPEADPNLIEAGTPAGEAPTPEHGGIEEIMVSAQKRSTNIQTTPTAITALSGAQLFDRGIYDVESLATQVPNFQYGENFGIARLTIRGIGNEGFTDPSTAFHVDGVYQNNQTAASALTFYDIAQVEVLRGPQGTLWGRNSTAGAINVSTRAPEHELDIFGDMLYGSYNQWFGRGVVNVPILADRVAMRTAVYFDKRDGYQDNLTYQGNGQDADDADSWGIRPQILFEVTDEISLIMRGSYGHQGGVGWASKIQGDYPAPYRFAHIPGLTDIWTDPYHSNIDGEPMAANPSDPREIRRDARQFQNIDTWDVNGTLTWDFSAPALGDVSLSIVGSYRDENRDQNFDVDLSDQSMIVSNVTASTRDRVIDAHLRSDSESSTQWLVGFFMLDADGQVNLDLPGGGGSSTIYAGAGGKFCLPTEEPNPSCLNLSAFGAILDDIHLLGARTGGSNDTLSLAGYLNVSHQFLEDQFRVGAGLRYSYDRSQATRYSDEVSAVSDSTFGGLPIPQLTPGNVPPTNCLQPGTSTDEEESWDGVTGDMKLEFLPTEENMAYISVSRGYKPGYINGNAVDLGCGSEGPPVVPPSVTALPNAKDEGIWAYELGSKNRFLDNTVQANFTAFLYQYDNLQVSSQFDNTGYIQNAARAQVRGVEFEGIWEPIENLNLSMVYGYLNAKYLDYVGFNFATGEIEDFSGNQMVRAPKHTATLAAEYLWDLGENGSIIPRVQYFVSDSIYFNAANSPDSLEPSYGTLQLRARWESAENDLFLETFVENVTDEDVRSTRSVGSGLLGRPITVAYEPPRTWGIRIGASY